MNPLSLAALLSLSSLRLFPASAFAQAPGEHPAPAVLASPESAHSNVATPAPTATETVSYRKRVMLTDAAIWLSLGLTANDDSNVNMTKLLLLGMVVGSPVVHFANDNTRSALWSLGLRVGLPAIGIGIGGSSCDEGVELQCTYSMLLGATIGYLSAVALDWGILAKKKREVPAGYANLRPIVQVRDGGTLAGVGFFF